MFFDTHTHLDLLSERSQLSIAQIITNSQVAGVQKCLWASVRASQFQPFLQQVQPFASDIAVGLGLHPLFIHEHCQTDLDLLEKHLENPPTCLSAVAEIGLDRSSEWLVDLWQKQCDFFTAQLALAQQYYFPVSLHSRKTHNELLRLLKQATLPQVGKRGLAGVLHGFSGSFQQGKAFIDSGLLLGVGGVITYPRAKKTRDAIARLPLDCLVLETDSPDMPLIGQQGKANRPSNLPLIFKTLCEIKGLNNETAIANAQQILWQNAQDVFSR